MRLALGLALLALAGCTTQRTSSVGPIVVDERPEVLVYASDASPGAVAFVWGAGPVNLNCNLVAFSSAHPAGQLGTRHDFGAGYAGAFDHTPVPGDTLRGALLPHFPAAESLHATRGGFVLGCVLPDTLVGYAWAIVPAGPYGPDSIVTFATLVRHDWIRAEVLGAR